MATLALSPFFFTSLASSLRLSSVSSGNISLITLPSLLGVGYGYRGYFDLHASFATVNSVTGEKIQGKISLVYDPQEQTQDSLKLQLYYNPNTPDYWSKTQTDYETVSCDISSLVNLQQWKDSVTIVVKSGDKEKHHTKISKNDFLKPGKH